jgi:CRP-like cAMP-binding protein
MTPKEKPTPLFDPKVLHEQPVFSELFLRYVLARVLQLLANFGKEGRPEPVIPKISRQMLAEIIGTTRARVNFFMNRFRKPGFIEYNGGLHVHSSLLNVVLHD